MKKTVYAILKEVNEQTTEKKREAKLREYATTNLKTILDYTFNDLLKFDLPPGIPPFQAEQAENTEPQLLSNAKKLYMFLAPPRGVSGMSKTKKERIFVDMLSTLHKDDAELLCFIKDNKKLPFPNVTKKLVQKTWPTLIKEV